MWINSTKCGAGAYPAIFTPFVDYSDLMPVAVKQVRSNEAFKARTHNKAFYREH